LTLKENLTYHSLRFLSAILSHISDHTAASFGSRIGTFAYHYFPVRKKEAQNHLKIAFPDWTDSYHERMLKRVYNHFGQIFVDALRLDSINTEVLITVENIHLIDRALADGKGLIGLSGHFGNWEMIAIWFARKGYQFYPVIRSQKNRGADRFFMQLRRRIGTFPLYTRTSPQEIIHILRKGKIVALVSDQDARRRGVFVRFFGMSTSTPKGAAIFHLKTGAPLIMAFCYRKGDGTYHLRFEQIPVEVEEGDPVTIITQRFTSRLEDEIRKRPEQYFWFHRRWKTKHLS